MYKKLINLTIIAAFLLTGVQTSVRAEEINLPKPGTMVSLSPAFHSIVIQGLRVHPENPFQFDFIVDTGDSTLDPQSPEFNQEVTQLIKHFLTSLTIPENDVWVNLSPYEKDRIIADSLGKTPMGREMLAQDYILKQLTASLIYPEKSLGEKFWKKVYAEAYQKYGHVNIPVNTFNKVWIVPDKAEVYEDGNSAYVSDSHLKVMLETDYLSSDKNNKEINPSNSPQEDFAKQAVREIILPVLEKEINTGKNFSSLRQIYNSMILAEWFKVKLEKNILGQIYVNQSKTSGIETQDKDFGPKIYKMYLEAYKKGAYNFIREEQDIQTHEAIPRKYFSGGLVGVDRTMLAVKTDRPTRNRVVSRGGKNDRRVLVRSLLQGVVSPDSAMLLPLQQLIEKARQATADEQLTAWEAVLEFDPRNTQALNAMGNIHLKKPDLGEAQRMFERARSIDPRNTEALNGLARSLMAQGQKKEAVDTYNHLLNIHPNNALAWEGLGEIYPYEQHTSTDYQQLYANLTTTYPNHNIYRLLFGNALLEMGWRDLSTGQIKHFWIHGLGELRRCLNIVLDSNYESLHDYVAVIQTYLISVIRSLPPSPALNQIRADLYRMSKHSSGREYLSQLQTYLDHFVPIETDPVPIKNWVDANDQEGLYSENNFFPVAESEVQDLLARFHSPRKQNLPWVFDRVLFEDEELVLWECPNISFPDGVYLYENSKDPRSMDMKKLWKTQEGKTGQIFIGYKSGKLKIPIAMIQAVKYGEAVFLFMSPEKVNALLPSEHPNSQVKMIADFIREKVPTKDKGDYYASRGEVNTQARELDQMLHSLVNVRGASGSIFAETEDYFYIQSVMHLMTGSGQHLHESRVNSKISFYADGFRHVFQAEVINQGEFFEGGSAAGFRNDTVFLRIKKSELDRRDPTLKDRIHVPSTSRLRKISHHEWLPHQPLAMFGIFGGKDQIAISYGYTANIPKDKIVKDEHTYDTAYDARVTKNVPTLLRSVTGFSGGPIFTMFSGPTRFVGARNRQGWNGANAEIHLGYASSADSILRRFYKHRNINFGRSSPGDFAMTSEDNEGGKEDEIASTETAEEFAAHERDRHNSPLIPKAAVGSMPIMVNKEGIVEGRIDIVYNPDGAEERYFPSSLRKAKAVSIEYSYGDDVRTVPMVLNDEGLWQVVLVDAQGHQEINYTFIEDERRDPQSYRTYFFVDQDQQPLTIIDAHAHTHIGYQQHDTHLVVALVSGGIEQALFFDRNNTITEKVLKMYPQLRALAWVTLTGPLWSGMRTNKFKASRPDEILGLLKNNPSFVGLKLHPTLDKMKINNTKVKDFLRELSKLKHPEGLKYSVLIHSASEYSEAKEIAELAKEFPNINFIVGHMFIDDDPVKRQEVINLAKKAKNVFLETSWASKEDVVRAIQQAGAEKVLFGADAQSSDHYDKIHGDKGRYADLIKFLQRELTPQQFALVISKNSKRLFGFKDRGDYAMLPGGIDLNATKAILKIKRSGDGTIFSFSSIDEAIQRVEGFEPLIMSVTPMNSPLLSDSLK